MTFFPTEIMCVWMCLSVFLLWMRSGGCTEKANTSDLMEYTAADFYEKLHSGKMMFIYFEHQVSPTVSLFLVELEKSVEALQDYGLDMSRSSVPVSSLKIYLTLCLKLSSLSSPSTSSAILREEVKYVHTDADLLAMEKAARGKKDLVLGYVRSLGTQEHRSMMETAYVYGSKYQFILITGGPVLKHLGVDELSHSSQVWFLHCRLHSSYRSPMTSERCPLTRMRKPLSTLSLHSFLQLMEAPLSEVYEDPSSVQPPVFPYQQTPQVFLFARPATEHLDRETAVTLAWRLRGLALLVLVHRYMLDDFTQEVTSCFHAEAFLLILLEYVKYLTLHDFNEVLDLFTNEEEGEEDEDEAVEEDSHVGELDDEVAASLYENRGDLLDMDSITQLTSENFHAAVAQSSLTVVLFYLRWDAVAMAFLSSYIEVAERLEGSEVQMCAVDCGEWTDLCAAQTGGSPPIPFRPITPELTVENLPSFLSLGKALLLLFVGEEEDEIGWRQNQALLEEMRGVVELGGGKMERYLACWIHLGRTPAGMSVLGSYLGSMPPLPALVLTHLPSGDEIYQYPSNTPIGAPAVLQWLQRVEDGKESPAGMLGDDSWPPAHDFYDFLKVMDMQEPESAQQRTPSAHDHYEDVDEATVEGNDVEEGTGSSSSSRLSAPDNNANLHSEL
uniref:Thioredoxin domain containing 16 n=1 Tax=Labrus bergylta TaxID=56723 RepID=A0A3Q3FJ86_9LABR